MARPFRPSEDPGARSDTFPLQGLLVDEVGSRIEGVSGLEKVRRRGEAGEDQDSVSWGLRGKGGG